MPHISLTETANLQQEYERRRKVWRYLHDYPGPQIPPVWNDDEWLLSDWEDTTIGLKKLQETINE